MIQILVGATIVGSIETVWCGMVTPPREGIIKRWTYPQADKAGAIFLKKYLEDWYFLQVVLYLDAISLHLLILQMYLKKASKRERRKE